MTTATTKAVVAAAATRGKRRTKKGEEEAPRPQRTVHYTVVVRPRAQATKEPLWTGPKRRADASRWKMSTRPWRVTPQE